MCDIADAIEQLATAIEDQPSVIRIWTVATLASRLRLEVAISASPDPVDAIVEFGEIWADSVAQQLADEPHRQGDALRAAHTVVQRLLAHVPAADSLRPATLH